MKTLKSEDVPDEFVEILNKIVQQYPISAYNGLVTIAMAYNKLLDQYARPSKNNPQGMCDDPQEMKDFFANIVATGEVTTDVISVPNENVAGSN